MRSGFLTVFVGEFLGGWKRGTWYDSTFHSHPVWLRPYVSHLVFIGDGDLIIDFHPPKRVRNKVTIPTRDATVEGHIIRFFSVRCVNFLMNYHSAFRQGTPSSQSALPDSSLAPGMEDDPWTVLDYKYAKRTRIPSHFKFAFISRRTRYPIFIQQESRKSLLYKFPFEMNSSRSIFEVHS